MKLHALFLLFPIVANADVLPLDDALRATYTACVGIDDELTELKKMAGINTVVTGVGTGLGIGATVVGVTKASEDAYTQEEIEKLIREIRELEQDLEPSSNQDLQQFYEEFVNELNDNPDVQEINNNIDESVTKSKKLGKWRTGLMAGNTATNIAGAIISGKNRVDDDLQTQIDNCKVAVKSLRNSISQARTEGADSADIDEANKIVSVCGQYENVDVSKINTRGKGAMVSSIIGTTTGVAGTVASAVANTDDIRKDTEAKEGKKTNEDWQKEKNVNTAANVLAGASTVASGVATVFNATQISAIKKVAGVAAECTEVLK